MVTWEWSLFGSIWSVVRYSSAFVHLISLLQFSVSFLKSHQETFGLDISDMAWSCCVAVYHISHICWCNYPHSFGILWDFPACFELNSCAVAALGYADITGFSEVLWSPPISLLPCHHHTLWSSSLAAAVGLLLHRCEALPQVLPSRERYKFRPAWKQLRWCNMDHKRLISYVQNFWVIQMVAKV